MNKGVSKIANISKITNDPDIKKPWKLQHVDYDAMQSLRKETDSELSTGKKKKECKLEKIKLDSERALITKGIMRYIQEVEDVEVLKSRMIYGFLNKRSKGNIKYYQTRWFFLISSRPLVRKHKYPKFSKEYQKDDEILWEKYIPPSWDFDTIYYFKMDSEDDDSDALGSISTLYFK